MKKRTSEMHSVGHPRFVCNCLYRAELIETQICCLGLWVHSNGL